MLQMTSVFPNTNNVFNNRKVELLISIVFLSRKHEKENKAFHVSVSVVCKYEVQRCQSAKADNKC